MTFVFAGYFPKKIEAAVDAMGLPGVSEIWSASNCISGGPVGWIDHWKHNRLGLFETVDLAQSVVPVDERKAFRIVAFRIGSRNFAEDGETPLDLSDIDARPDAGYVVIGYDAVSSTHGHGFECSPLSCNGGAKLFPVNPKCLFETADHALVAARQFASGNWEPGPYLVVEVLAQREDTGTG